MCVCVLVLVVVVVLLVMMLVLVLNSTASLPVCQGNALRGVKEALAGGPTRMQRDTGQGESSMMSWGHVVPRASLHQSRPAARK